MVLELLRLAIALVGSAYGGWADWKTTDVPDRLVFGMIAAGLLLNGAEWVVFGQQEPAVLAALTTAAFGAFALAMYKAGAWGGGDGAMLTAVGSLLPAWPIASGLAPLPFPLVYFVAVFVVGLPWSTLYSLREVWRSPLRGAFVASLRAWAWLVALLAVVGGLALTAQPGPLSALLAALLLVLVPVWQLARFAERVFYRRISTRQLRAGDMLGEDLPRLKLWKRELRGLTAAEVARIRKLKRSVVTRSGVRYTPVFFITLVLLLAVSLLY